MSKVSFQLRYDGPALSEHGMDVADLAPALLALGELVKRANASLNGEATKVSLIVQSDFEHKCFQVNLELVQSIISAIGSFLTDEHHLKNAQTIAGWLGLIGLPPTVIGLFKYLAKRKAQEIESVSSVAGSTALSSSSSHGDVVIKFKGDDNTIIVNQNVYRLGEDPVIRDYAAKVVSPLKRNGIESLQFDPERSVRGETITKQDAEAIFSGRTELATKEVETFEPQSIIAHLQIIRPDFSPDAQTWRFLYGEKVISVDISDTDIAEQVRARGFVRIGDTWRVRMLITEKRTASGQYRNDYKVSEVLDFLASAQQTSLPFIFDDDAGL